MRRTFEAHATAGLPPPQYTMDYLTGLRRPLPAFDDFSLRNARPLAGTAAKATAQATAKPSQSQATAHKPSTQPLTPPLPLSLPPPDGRFRPRTLLALLTPYNPATCTASEAPNTETPQLLALTSSHTPPPPPTPQPPPPPPHLLSAASAARRRHAPVRRHSGDRLAARRWRPFCSGGGLVVRVVLCCWPWRRWSRQPADPTSTSTTQPSSYSPPPYRHPYYSTARSRCRVRRYSTVSTGFSRRRRQHSTQTVHRVAAQWRRRRWGRRELLLRSGCHHRGTRTQPATAFFCYRRACKREEGEHEQRRDLRACAVPHRRLGATLSPYSRTAKPRATSCSGCTRRN